MMTFAERFKGYVRTSTPLVMVNTFDPRATQRNIVEVLKNTEVKSAHELKPGAPQPTLLSTTGLSAWDTCTGWSHINKQGETQMAEATEQGIDPEALKVASTMYQMLYSVADNVLANHFVFITNAHKFWSEAIEIQALWNLRDKLKNKGSMVILLTAPGSTLPQELAQDVMPLEEPLPTDAQIGDIVDKAYRAAIKLAEKQGRKLPAALPEDVRKPAIAALSGLSTFPAETSAHLCLDTKTGTIDIPELWGYKRISIASRVGLSMPVTDQKLSDMADLDNIVDILNAYNAGPDSPNIILRFDELEKAFAGSGTDLSGDQTKLTGSILTWFADKRIAGFIFLGVPGSGKSNLLYAWANSVKKPVIDVDVPGMQGSLLGESMANLKAAEKTIDAMGGGKVLAIATVNDVSTLPAPLLRRFDVGTYFFDIPETQEGRLKILDIHRQKYGISKNDAVPDMNLWTGADIENCCKNARRFGKSLTDASQSIVKVMVARKDEMETLRRNASGRYISASKPGVYKYWDPYKVQASDDDTRALKG
jgi:hypothetical protein